jgi:hypothetical protein
MLNNGERHARYNNNNKANSILWHSDVLFKYTHFIVSSHLSHTLYTILKYSLYRPTCFDLRSHHEVSFKISPKLLHTFNAKVKQSRYTPWWRLGGEEV